MKKYYYLAYGSNLHPLRLQMRISSARWLDTGSIPGRQLRFNKKSDVDDSGKCSINDADNVVFVAVFEISAADKHVLDEIEGLGTGYEQESIHIDKYGDCFTYVANPNVIDEKILPMDWYKEMVLLGCRSNGFPDEYIRYVQSIGSIEDPDRERARANWKLVEALRNYAS